MKYGCYINAGMGTFHSLQATESLAGTKKHSFIMCSQCLWSAYKHEQCIKCNKWKPYFTMVQELQQMSCKILNATYCN